MRSCGSRSVRPGALQYWARRSSDIASSAPQRSALLAGRLRSTRAGKSRHRTRNKRWARAMLPSIADLDALSKSHIPGMHP
jgi:hypothetical protein